MLEKIIKKNILIEFTGLKIKILLKSQQDKGELEKVLF